MRARVCFSLILRELYFQRASAGCGIVYFRAANSIFLSFACVFYLIVGCDELCNDVFSIEMIDF